MLFIDYFENLFNKCQNSLKGECYCHFDHFLCAKILLQFKISEFSSDFISCFPSILWTKFESVQLRKLWQSIHFRAQIEPLSININKVPLKKEYMPIGYLHCSCGLHTSRRNKLHAQEKSLKREG